MADRPQLAFPIYVALCLALAGYFAFAAVQGDLGVLARMEIIARLDALTADRDALSAEVERLETLTLRLSDGYLDLDLLDERARDVLGMMRADELAIR